ncbi:MAG: glycosyltransferase family 4 protein [Chloroflexi bacterium]|nr:glycosyltransferase family 4 protein [Chloroflexota bacterium]
MKVRLLHTLPAARRTSSEVYASELTAALQRSAPPDLQLAHYYPRDLARASAPQQLARLAGYVDHYATYPWRAAAAPADVHHIVEHGYAHAALRLHAQRTVVTFHDAMLMKLAARELPVDLLPRLSIFANRSNLAGMRRAARIIAVSESSRQDLLRFTDIDPARVAVIHEGVSAGFRPCPQEARPVPGAPIRVLHVGHCAFYKNIDTVIRVVAALSRRLEHPVELVKVGGTFSPAQRELIARLQLGDRVRELGVVAAPDLPRVYRSADLLLMPSLHEGFGFPVLEAMACGTPVVASNAGSLPEVVGEAGLMADPLDIEGLVEASVRVLTDDHLREDLRRRGIERAARFTWERTAAATLDVYRSVHEEAA